jgi:hypothetical protein
MEKEAEARLVAEFADNPELWEEVPAPLLADERPRLGTQVTIRLDADAADQLRLLARRAGRNYTTMLRRWILERLDAEVRAAVADSTEPIRRVIEEEPAANGAA